MPILSRGRFISRQRLIRALPVHDIAGLRRERVVIARECHGRIGQVPEVAGTSQRVQRGIDDRDRRLILYS